MLQQNSFNTRPHTLRTAFVWITVALLMSVGSAQAASIGATDDSADRTTGTMWEFIFGDLISGCITPGGELWLAHPSQANYLAAATGVMPTQRTLAEFIGDLDGETVVRFEGGAPDSDGVTELANKGYDTATPVDPSPGFEGAVEYTSD